MQMAHGKWASVENGAEWGTAERGTVRSPDNAASSSTMTGTDLRLGNPIWHAALTRQQHLAYGEGLARRFYPDVVPLAAIENHSAEAMAALTALVSPGERVWLFEEPPALDPAQWRESRRIAGYQMLCSALPPEAAHNAAAAASVLLDPISDAPAMEALKAIAFPGFFGPRTPQMGRYRGIR